MQADPIILEIYLIEYFKIVFLNIYSCAYKTLFANPVASLESVWQTLSFGDNNRINEFQIKKIAKLNYHENINYSNIIYEMLIHMKQLNSYLLSAHRVTRK